MPKVKLLVPVTYSGAIVEAGEEIELSKRSAESLISDNMAELIPDLDPATLGVTNVTGAANVNGQEGDPDPLKNENNGQGENPDKNENDDQGENPDKNETDNQDELAKVVKALNDRYKRDELATAAKELGVEFAYDAKKAEIIEAVIAAGKAEVMLKV